MVTVGRGWNLWGKKEADLLSRHRSPGEQVLGQVIGNFNQAIVATDRKVLILKTGLMAGQTFGGKATSYDYGNIVGVEARTGFSQGEFEILAGGLANTQGNRRKDKAKMSEAPNGVVFAKVTAKPFDAMAAKIREMSGSRGAPRAPAAAAPPAPAAVPAPVGESRDAIFDAIRKLGELHDAGILNDEEFAAKKAELLARI